LVVYSSDIIQSWPSHFAQEMSHLFHRQNEYGGLRLNLEQAKAEILTKNLLKALSTYSKNLETAAIVRTVILNHLVEHQKQNIKLIPRWERSPNGTAMTVEKPGTTVTSPRAPVPEMIITSTPQLDLKIHLTKRPAKLDPDEKVVGPDDPPLKEVLIGNKLKRVRISSVALY